MFEIEYKGANGVIIATKKNTAVIDPHLSPVGLKDIKPDNAIEIATEAQFAINSKESQLSIEGPGEYELGDFSIRGISAARYVDGENDEKIATIYRIEIGDVRIALLGNIAAKLDEEQLEALGVVDLLLIPVGGGGYTLDATSAAGLVRQIDPKVVIPLHYADSAIHYEMPQDTAETFIKELGSPVEEVSSKYKVKASSTLPQTLTIVKIART